jgi:cobaltochelatase CobS
MTVPCADGVSWQDGQLTRAIQTPGCVICLDEPSVARPGALFVLQNVLANRVLFITETGRRVPVAKGVVFIATDNTNGTGGGGRRGYTDTNRLNAAFLDRFGVRIKFDFMPADQETAILCSYIPGCTKELAALLVNAAVTTRQCADQQQLTAGIGLRRLLAWAELLVDGHSAEDAFNAAVLNCVPEQDVETLRQQCLLAYDAANVSAALNPAPIAPAAPAPDAADPAFTNPSTAGRLAANAFRGV